MKGGEIRTTKYAIVKTQNFCFKNYMLIGMETRKHDPWENKGITATTFQVGQKKLRSQS